MVFSNDLKKAICFGLVIGAIISFCNLCFAAEDVTLTNIRLGFGSYSLGSYGEFVEGSANLAYFQAEPGYKYTITNNSNSNSLLVISNDVPNVGVSFYADRVINKNSTYSFNSSEYKYLYFTESYSLTVSREPLERFK